MIFVNDNVWVEGTGMTTRITIAASGQFNSPASTVDVNIVGDLTYAAWTVRGRGTHCPAGREDTHVRSPGQDR